jgi:hypothetical protein
VFGLAAIAGCRSDGPTMIPIRGEVLFKGAPLKDVPKGFVHYLPKTSEGRQATARLQPDGSFEMTTLNGGDGVVPGDYVVVVSAYTAKAQLSRAEVEAAHGVVPKPGLMIPERYTEPTTSGLSDTVDSNHSGFKRIELTE